MGRKAQSLFHRCRGKKLNIAEQEPDYISGDRLRVLPTTPEHCGFSFPLSLCLRESGLLPMAAIEILFELESICW